MEAMCGTLVSALAIASGVTVKSICGGRRPSEPDWQPKCWPRRGPQKVACEKRLELSLGQDSDVKRLVFGLRITNFARLLTPALKGPSHPKRSDGGVEMVQNQDPCDVSVFVSTLSSLPSASSYCSDA